MKHQPRSSEHVNPNLIPMIDLMFLLLLFITLRAGMRHRVLEEVVLPMAESAIRDHAPEETLRRLTINASHKQEVACPTYRSRNVCRDEAHWEISFRGRNCTD